MEVTITDVQSFSVGARPKDAKRNPAQVQDPQWLSSNTALLSVTPDPADPLKATVAAVGPLSDPANKPQVIFSADADLGDGVVPIQGTLDVNIIAGQAVAVELEPGAPA